MAFTWRRWTTRTEGVLCPRAKAAPTLLLLGDNDIVTIPHSEEMHRALPQSELVVVAGATHGLPMEKPDVVSRLVLDFLAGDSAGGP